jgi:ABC-2 type transport system ATP-binding protein
MAAKVAVRNLRKRYGDIEAARGVSFEIQDGEIFGLLGPNGSGKTTTVECVIGLREPDDGEIEVCGIDARRRPQDVKQKIGAALQTTALQDKITPREALTLFGAFYRNREDPQQMLDRFALTSKADAPFDTLSGGQRQRLALALAFVNNPQLVFLDEPTAGVDPVARRELWDLLFQLAAQGITLLVTTHYMDEAERCGRVGYLHLGTLLAIGTPSDLKKLPEVTPPGFRRVEIVSPDTAELLNRLRKRPTVGEATIFGQSVHALVADGDNLADISGPDIVIHPTTANLEDVFVTIARNRTRELAENQP